MVQCATWGRGLRARGRWGSVRVETGGWQAAPADAPGLPAVDATTSGVTTRLSLPGEPVVLRGPEGREPPTTGTLSGGEYLLALDGSLETLVRFDGPARIHTDGIRADGGTRPRTTGGAELVFEDPVPVTVGFRETDPHPPTVTVPESPAGVATALTLAGAALHTLDPDRSHPDRRAHPPLVRFGTREVPTAVRRAVPEAGVEVVGPPSYDWLYVTAPLAYYLGATVRVEDGRDRPRLLAPDAGVDRALPPGSDPALADEVAALLRRTFFLDCLARDRPPARLGGRDVLAELGLAAGDLRARSPAGRLEAYLAAPFERVTGALPDWPLATYVDPVPGTAPGLPHLLARLSLVYPASGSPLDGETLLQRAVEGFLRGCGSAGDVAEVDRLEPDLRVGAELHGWLAEGTPIEAFESSRTAYRNGLEADTTAGLDIAVVCNEPEMRGERCVAERYRERVLPGVDVTVHQELDRDGLARVFERPHDLVHYVGHCERQGFRCADGHLAASEPAAIRARTFVLNACGSYHQGRELLRRGSVVGAVTLSTVLDGEATTVGRTLAWLLSEGFGFERALSLARGEIMMGTDYAIVGDGTHALVPRTEAPELLRVATVKPEQSWHAADRFGVRCERGVDADPGRTYPDPFADGCHLDCGAAGTELDRRSLADLLDGWAGPVLLEGRLRPAAELARELTGGPQGGPRIR